MKLFKEILGYALGGLMFVGAIPLLFWFLSGRPFPYRPCWGLAVVAILLMLSGLALSVWSIVYMKRVGKGNPMDAFGHEVAPRTRHLMTDGPYRLSRNPMLSGTFLYLTGICLWLWRWPVWLWFALFVVIMLMQVRSEEKRLLNDFGDEYRDYYRRTGRFLPFNWRKGKE